MKRLFARIDWSDPTVVKQVIDYAVGLVYRVIEWIIGIAFAVALLGGAHWLFTH